MKDTALSEHGRGAAWPVWINGMAWQWNGMLCVNRPWISHDANCLNTSIQKAKNMMSYYIFFPNTFAVCSSYYTTKCTDCILWLNQLHTRAVQKSHVTKPIQTTEMLILLCIFAFTYNQRLFSSSVNWNLRKQSQFPLIGLKSAHLWQHTMNIN